MNFSQFSTTFKPQIENALEAALLPLSSHASPVFYDAIHYSLFGESKRIRPLITVASFLLFQEEVFLPRIFPVGISIEFIHTYSLIHDDLPAMDNSDFRRSRASCHKVFGEDVAILVGDLLQTYAFDYFSTHLQPYYASELVLKSLGVLTKSSGIQGLVGGQFLDIQKDVSTLLELEKMHLAKTGALIAASVLIPAYLENANTEIIEALKIFSDALGLLFQIADDILDTTANIEFLGKPSHQDEHKKTYVALLGLEGAKKKASIHYELAKDCLYKISCLLHSDRTKFLLEITTFIYRRSIETMK
jgi:geranylgeranyl diphosphate synthase type II